VGLEDIDGAHQRSRLVGRSRHGTTCAALELGLRGNQCFLCDGEVAFQTVFHLHVIPSYEADDWTLKAESPPEREGWLLERDAQTIRDAIAATDLTLMPLFSPAVRARADDRSSEETVPPVPISTVPERCASLTYSGKRLGIVKTLPCPGPHPTAPSQVTNMAVNAEYRSLQAGPQRPARAAGPIRVVIVDDHELFLGGLGMLLNLEDDIEVVGEATDGGAAADLVAATVPDVVLMDVRMPKRSGIEACQTIKEVAPDARIIMLTSSDEEADLLDAVKNGASGYLLKDSSIDEVANAVRLVLKGDALISPSMATKLLDEFKQVARADRQSGPTPRLTSRELDVLRLVAQGLSSREIGSQLIISEHTVKNHVRNTLEKLHLHSRLDAVMYAIRERWSGFPFEGSA
jgi:DNA-binding NarL/FixJ family response regulator